MRAYLSRLSFAKTLLLIVEGCVACVCIALFGSGLGVAWLIWG